jgi:outer membrane protein assembly factor BamB
VLNYKGNVLNNRLFTKVCLLTLLSTALFACSSTDDEESDPTLAAELTEINNAFSPRIVWSKNVGNGVDDYFSRLKPVAGYGKIYSANRIGDVYAFDLDTGKKVWHADLQKNSSSDSFFASSKSALLAGGPTIGMNKVFIGSENGEVYSLDADSGSLVWQAQVKGEVISAPAVDNGTLVVNSASGILKAFDATEGTEQWKIEQDVPALTLRGVSSPALAGGGAVIGSSDGTLTVFILESGQQGWTVEVGEASGSTELERVIDIDSKPLIYGDKVYAISAKGNLVALDLRSGRMLWKRQYSSFRQLSMSGNNLFLTDVKGHVYAIDRANGLERWSQLALTNRSVTGPAILADHVVVGDYEGYLHWLDKESGEIVARYQLDSSGIFSTPTVAKEILYVQSRDGDLQAIATP